MWFQRPSNEVMSAQARWSLNSTHDQENGMASRRRSGAYNYSHESCALGVNSPRRKYAKKFLGRGAHSHANCEPEGACGG